MPKNKYIGYFSTPSYDELQQRVNDKQWEKYQAKWAFEEALKKLEKAVNLIPGGGISFIKCDAAQEEFNLVCALWIKHPDFKYKMNHPRHWMWPYYTPEQQAAYTVDRKQREKEDRDWEIKEALKEQEEKRTGADEAKNDQMLSLKLHPPQSARINALHSEQWTTRSKIIRAAMESFVKAPLLMAPFEQYELPIAEEGWLTAYVNVTVWINKILKRELKKRQIQGKWPRNTQYMFRFILDWWMDANYPRIQQDEEQYARLPRYYHQPGDETLRYIPYPGRPTPTEKQPKPYTAREYSQCLRPARTFEQQMEFRDKEREWKQSKKQPVLINDEEEYLPEAPIWIEEEAL